MKRSLTFAGLTLLVTAGSLLVHAEDSRAPSDPPGFLSRLIGIQSGHEGTSLELPRYIAGPQSALTDKPAETVAPATAITVRDSLPPPAAAKPLAAAVPASDPATSAKSGASETSLVAISGFGLRLGQQPASSEGSRSLKRSAIFDGEADPKSSELVAASRPAVIYPVVAGAVPVDPDPNSAAAPNPDGKAAAKPPPPAKDLFGFVKNPAPLSARAIGGYAKGCLAGAKALPIDGPTWQAMRLSRNRNWGHPNLIKLVERLATEAKEKDGWPGLLIGDLSQPRGGPMLTGHASHQVGLDADIWLMPMPNRRLSKREREDLSATSMLDTTGVAVDTKVFTEGHVKLIKRAAEYPEIERVLVHPAIKKALCQTKDTDRTWLGKVRPIFGHHYHMHLRIGCPAGSASCVSQVPVKGDDGCGKEVDDWLARVKPKPPGPGPKPPEKGMVIKPGAPRPGILLADLPAECRMVIEAPGNDDVREALAAEKAAMSRKALAAAKAPDVPHNVGKHHKKAAAKVRSAENKVRR